MDRRADRLAEHHERCGERAQDARREQKRQPARPASRELAVGLHAIGDVENLLEHSHRARRAPQRNDDAGHHGDHGPRASRPRRAHRVVEDAGRTRRERLGEPTGHVMEGRRPHVRQRERAQRGDDRRKERKEPVEGKASRRHRHAVTADLDAQLLGSGLPARGRQRSALRTLTPRAPAHAAPPRVRERLGIPRSSSASHRP